MSARNSPFSLIVYGYANQWREARASGKSGRICGHWWKLHAKRTSLRQNIPTLEIKIGSIYRIDLNGRCVGHRVMYRSFVLGNSGKNAAQSESAQIGHKLMWKDSNSGRPMFVFARTTARASAFAHRLIAPCSFAHISLGDIVSGVIDTPRSEQCATCLLSWGVPDAAFLLRIHGSHLPE